MYMLEELNDAESLRRFSCHAFRSTHPKEEYTNLSMSIISYWKGRPPALAVLGSFLVEARLTD